jgi:glycosidase
MMKNAIILLGILALVFLVQACGNQADKKTSDQSQAKAELPVEWSKNAVIYEVNLRQYTNEGTFKAFEANLPRLKEMGVDILWFMPIHPIGLENRKGSLGSYYAVQDYSKVNPEYGTMDDFKSLVAKAHELGMYIILDWVANHSAWDHPWVRSNPEYYDTDNSGKMVSPFDWTDVVAFDFENAGLRKAMQNEMLFWVKDIDIDGFRCDVAGEIPTAFWEETSAELNKVKPVFMLAEAEKAELVNKAFDMDYGWNQHHIMNQIAEGKMDVNQLNAYFNQKDSIYAARSYKLYFITNHDENSWNGTEYERMGEAVDAMAVLTFTIGDMPLIYNGQESAFNRRLLFFEKDIIDWGNYPKADFYTKLASLKHTQQALWNGSYGNKYVRLKSSDDAKIFAYDRGNVRVILNLSAEDLNFSLENVDLTGYISYIENGFKPLETANNFSLTKWGYAVFVK